MLQLFHPSLTWFIVAGLPFIFLSLLPPFSAMTISWNRWPQPRKSLRGFRILSRRSTVTKPWWECRYKGLSKGEVREQRRKRQIREIWPQRFPSRYLRRSGEWPARKCQETCSGPWRVGQKSLRHSHENMLLLKKSARWVTNRLSLVMTKELFRMCKVAESRLGANSELAGLILVLEAS